MLVLAIKEGSSAFIGDSEVKVCEIRRDGFVALGFSFPDDVTILREKIYRRVQAEREAATVRAAGESH